MEKEHLVTILKNKEIATHIFDMEVEAPELVQKAQTGQFVHVLCPDGFLRRPISICDCVEDRLRIVYRAEGKGTKSLSQMKPGETVSMLGPLGNGFHPVAGRTLVVGGGLGVFPLLHLSKQLEDPVVILGFASKAFVCLEEDFQNPRIFTDDGSYGEKGLVTAGLLEELEKSKPARIYACGPEPMLKAIEAIAKERGISYEVSYEARMGCGVGACLVCNCEREGKYRRVCKDGPVFSG